MAMLHDINFRIVFVLCAKVHWGKIVFPIQYRKLLYRPRNTYIKAFKYFSGYFVGLRYKLIELFYYISILCNTIIEWLEITLASSFGIFLIYKYPYV